MKLTARIDNRPSATAQRVALRRAAHQLLDRPRVLEDRLALAILGAEQAAALRADPRRFNGDPLALVLRAFLVVRSRIAEEALALAVARGIQQYVVLGAGLDTFAYRNPYPKLRVVEVDHPATQAWKRRRLAEAGIEVPASVAFASIDFESQQLIEVLRQAGVVAGRPSFFSWLGVTQYLEPTTVLATLSGLVALAQDGGGVVFDYTIAPDSLEPTRRAAFDVLAARVRAAGEPFRGFFDPPQLVGELTRMGYRHTTDLGPEQINARYFAGRADGLRVGSVGHIMTALA